jgi:uncharacterized sulfatase
MLFRRLAIVALTLAFTCINSAEAAKRPNILLAISDDQAYPFASAYGYKAVNTPAFDRLATSGVLFRNCFAGSPGCAPSRAALLTGRHHWQLEQAGTHASSFPTTYVSYPDLLQQAGYCVGYTGKGWGPGNWKISGRTTNPAGPEFNRQATKAPKGAKGVDYAANFAEFLATRSPDQPFCFWYGGKEPHRSFEAGAGLKAGKKLADATVPAFLPDTPEVRSDLLDYCVEIEWFDSHLGKMLDLLTKAGELDNTLVIVTGDNGMPFPRGKANMYEAGIHVPLVVAWPASVPAGRTSDDLVGFVDLSATILEAAGVEHPGKQTGQHAPVGHSILKLLKSNQTGLIEPGRDMVYSGRERHSSARYNNWGYPTRALRTHDYLYIRNFHPERWPAGDPQPLDKDGKLGPPHGGYNDIDASPTLAFLVSNDDDPAIGRFLHLAVDKRPAEELFDIKRDPHCLKNLASDPSLTNVRERLAKSLDETLRSTGDPRMGSDPEIWETYPRYSPLRQYPQP